VNDSQIPHILGQKDPSSALLDQIALLVTIQLFELSVNTSYRQKGFDLYRTPPHRIMTDPLSISAAISGIITFADVVYGHGSRFRRGCKDCPREIKQLVLEIYNLKGVFEALEPLTDDAANAGHRKS